MKVFIESTLNSTASGNIELNTTPSATIDSLINAFCIEKGIRHRSHYVLKTQQNIVLDNIKTLASSGINNEDLLFLTTKNEEDRVFGFNNWWTMAAVALSIAIIGLTAIIVIYISSVNLAAYDYGIVFDAGSTHTDMFIYEWEADTSGTRNIKQINNCRLKGGGIEDHALDPEILRNEFQSCLNKTTEDISPEEKKKSHIYLGATAGMRILNISNADQAAKIMNIIDDILKNSGFAYESGQARILTGQEEGGFAWITSNYALNKLQQEENTVGILDLGGASTQIAFQTQSNSTSSDVNILDLQLYGKSYIVYSNSALCYGKTEMEKRFKIELILENPEASAEISNPCGYIGNNETLYIKDLFDKVCTRNLTEITRSLPENVTFIGSSNAEQCKSKVSNLLNFTQCQGNYPYCFNYADLPETKGTSFYGINGYFYVMEFFNVSDGESLNDVIFKVDSFCNKTWEEIKDIPVPDNSTNLLLQYCFDGQYILHLLTNSFKFDNSSWKNLRFKSEENGVSFDWAFGFMVNATNSIPQDLPQESITLPVFICLIVLFSGFFLVAVAFGYHAWKHGHRSSSYQRFSQYGAI